MSKRIEYIDALRGFTMFLVVLCHIYTLALQRDSVINGYFTCFRMPTFFFISGFVLYKNTIEWNKEYITGFLSKKAKIQILPTVIFFSIYEWLIAQNWVNDLTNSGKGGYWFTITLFAFFVFYAICRAICQLFKWEGIKEDVFISIIAILFYVIFGQGIDPFDDALSMYGWRYFFFFSLGTLIKKHYDIFCKIIDNRFCMSLFLTVNVFGYLLLSTSNLAVIYIVLLNTIIAITGIVVLMNYFRNYESSFKRDTILGRVLQYVGQHTLEIYLIHFLIIPRNLSMIGVWFNNNSNVFLEFFVASLLAISVILICLLIGSLIRSSELLAKLLFGIKYKK